MKKLNESKMVKCIHYYLIGFTYLMPLMFIFVYVVTLIGFIQAGELISAKFTFFGLNLIETPKKIVFGRTADALIVLMFSPLMFSLFIMVFYSVLKFIKNVLSAKLLIGQNGILLKRIGFLIIGFAINNVVYTTFLNFEILKHDVIIGLFSKEFFSFFLLFPTFLLHPVFVFGLFFILLGEIVIKASLVKQENDLTV